MGTFFSKQKIDSGNYEKILSEYDNDIQKYEIKLSDIRIQDRRVGILWMLYSTVLWIVYVVYYLYALHGHYYSLEAQLLIVSPIFLGPICIYYIRRGLKWIYNKRLNNIEINLVSLRKKQKLKVEELKKKTAYYSTKSLLERYDPTSEKKKELDEQTKKKMIEEREKQNAAQKQYHQQPQQQQQKQSIRSENMQPMNTIMIQQPQSQKWYDKLVDALVGDVGPETKYALICIHCYAHNGLVLPQEVDNIQYTCPHCHQFNPSRKSRMLHPDGPVLPSMSPSSEPDHDNNIDLVSNSNSSKSATTEIKEKGDELRQRNTTVNEQQKEKPSTA